ncbi:hypothetical protein L5515_004222 [Caenorhabditis briggsae]|uniref:Uncharacterized protein n=2 Tax=Caenorhabditis briggsae TaxID=6238 RepID=A0AAE9EL68_CAEBR|nr:hypothetical protein L5515_004222 [Caenorhabditis briggsae]
MSIRKEELAKMLDTSLKKFTEVLSESKDLSKLNNHSKLNISKAEIDAIMSRMIQKTQVKVQEKTNHLIKENHILEQFDELEQLTKDSIELNQEWGRETGYNFVKPKRDIALHLSDSTDKMLEAADAEIKKLEKQLNMEEEEFDRRKQVLKELTTIIESQQEKLRN